MRGEGKMGEKLQWAIHVSKICLNDLGVDARFNGTTLNLILFVGQTLYCANVGDSRAVLY